MLTVEEFWQAARNELSQKSALKAVYAVYYNDKPALDYLHRGSRYCFEDLVDAENHATLWRCAHHATLWACAQRVPHCKIEIRKIYG